MARLPSNFLSFDQEPKARGAHGPPPAYRTSSGTVTEADTWSDYSGSSGLGKRRASWVNLVESDENLNKHKVNCYPKVKQTSNASQQVPSRAPSQLAYVSDNYRLHMINSSQALPVKAAPGPAGTLPSSRAPSVVIAPTVIRLHMQGAMPFKGNYISYYDFKTNRVAVIDETLKSNSKMCFVMPLDRSNLRDADTMRRAAGRASHKTSQTQGWEESWQYLPAPMTMNAQQLFNPPIKECEGARWIQLDYVGSNQKNRKCSDCYDFCLPDYGIERDVVRGDESLNIVRRVCFYLFVPEWRTYAQANTIEQNQRDFETYYRNRNHLATAYGSTDVSDTKWIQLQKLPQTIQNVTGNVADHLKNAANRVVNNIEDTVEGVRRGVYGQNRPDLSYQQQNYQNGNGYNGQMQPNSNPNSFGPPTVNGVVNLNGVNGHNGHTTYNNNGESMTRYGPNGLVNNGYPGDTSLVNPYATNPDRSSMPEINPNMPKHPQNGDQQEHNGQYGNQVHTPDQRDLRTVPYTNGNGFAASQAYNGRSTYQDVNGMNPPAGYVPQAETSAQGVAGMPMPVNANVPSSGYRPDVMPNPQYQQQISQQRWNSG
nr:Unknown [Haemonchus contortus]